VNRVPVDLVRELLAQSLKAWGVPGGVEHDGNGVRVIGQNGKSIRVDPAPEQVPFRWMVTADSRQRGAISLVAVLRQVREVLDLGRASNRVRVAMAPLVPP